MVDDPNNPSHLLKNIILQTLRQSHPQPLSSDELLSALRQQNDKLTIIDSDLLDDLIQANLVTRLIDPTQRRVVFVYGVTETEEDEFIFDGAIQIKGDFVGRDTIDLDDESNPRTASRLDGDPDDDTLPT